MSDKPGRNDPCPCGSGKKHKNCCWGKPPLAKKKITASVMGKKQPEHQPMDLMERTFGNAIERTKHMHQSPTTEEKSDLEKHPLPPM
jgi:uncharacterized protein